MSYWNRCCLMLAMGFVFCGQPGWSGLFAQDATASESVVENAGSDEKTANGDPSLLQKWDRLIYVPFRELGRVFNRQDASVVVPYAEFLELMKSAMDRAARSPASVDAVIRSADWDAVVEGDVVRLQLQLNIEVLKSSAGWVTIPLRLGNVAAGKIEASAGRVLLQAVGEQDYRLLIHDTTETVVSMEFMATVNTSPEARSFSVQCPSVGITNLQVTIPEADQDVQIAPLQVLRPVESDASGSGQTVVRAGLGAADQFEVRWFPRAGTRPEMDLLSSVSSVSEVRLETGLAQLNTTLDYEILRGQIEEVRLQVAPDMRVVDVTGGVGRIRSWNVSSVGETHQLLVVELLSAVTDRLQLVVQSERTFEGSELQLIGRTEAGVVQGIHADGVLRENGSLRLTTDPALTALVTQQAGVRQVGASESGGKRQGVAGTVWEHRGIRSVLAVRTAPVEPRVTVEQAAQYTFRDDEISIRSVLNFTVERAGVFQLALRVPEAMSVDSVSADGMSEFTVDQGTGRVVLTLTRQRMGKIEVTVLGHQDFDSSVSTDDLELPTIAAEGVERETGTLLVNAPEFLDVITIDDRIVGLVPVREAISSGMPGYRRIGLWSFTRQPISLLVRTVPRPAQVSGFVATTVQVDPEVLRVTSMISSDIRNAGVDQIRLAVPESVSEDVRFRVISSGHALSQRERLPDAEDGWVTWVLTLQREVTGQVNVSVEWEQSLEVPATGDGGDLSTDGAADGAAGGTERLIELLPPRLLSPWDEDSDGRRRVVMTPPGGELRVLRHESLSLQSVTMNEQMEQIDVRELTRLEQDGYFAWRYFSQPAAATIGIRRHEVHEVVETVVSRVAVEVVTESQLLASWRVRMRLTSSERQRLRVDLPVGSELQAPLLNGRRTTIEKAAEAEGSEGRETYYVNISRDESSDTEFGLTLLYRCAVGTEKKRPYDGTGGGSQLLTLPVIGDDDGATVIQQVKLAVWAPEDVRFTGTPQGWISEEEYSGLFDNILQPPSADRTAESLSEWVRDGLTADFPVQGRVAVFRRAGLRAEPVQLVWWKQYTLLGLISGSLALIGVVLRKTSLENRVTIVLLGMLAIAIAAVSQGSAVPDLIPLAIPGLAISGLLWGIGLLGGLSGPGVPPIAVESHADDRAAEDPVPPPDSIADAAMDSAAAEESEVNDATASSNADESDRGAEE